MRVLLDTCVILDALESRQPFSKDAEELFLAAANNLFTGCITAKAYTDIYYLMHRHTHSDKASREVLNKLFSLFEVVDSAGMDCRRAIPSPVLDFEDAVMIETAARTEVDYIVTRNIKDFARSSVSILTPKDFLSKLMTE